VFSLTPPATAKNGTRPSHTFFFLSFSSGCHSMYSQPQQFDVRYLLVSTTWFASSLIRRLLRACTGWVVFETRESNNDTQYTRNRWSSDALMLLLLLLADDVATSLELLSYIFLSLATLMRHSFFSFSLPLPWTRARSCSMSYVGERSHRIDYQMCTHKRLCVVSFGIFTTGHHQHRG